MPGAYLICSDGFRHVITEEEIYGSISMENIPNESQMANNIKFLINQNKKRKETDNITALLIKAEER